MGLVLKAYIFTTSFIFVKVSFFPLTMATRLKFFLAAYVNLESAWLDSDVHAVPFCALGKQLYLLVPHCFSYNFGFILVFIW